VINPDLASLRDARLFLDIARSLSYPRDKIMLLANKVTGKNEVSTGEIEKVLRMKIFGIIPSDEIRSLSCLNEGVPIFLKKPSHAISKAYKKFAQNLANTNFAVTTRLTGESTSEALKRISRLG
jgi:pilus assembly protein CpaE